MIKRVIISGGGTGGHIYPAIAIANALRNIQPDIEILFVGANGRMEMQKVPQAGYTIKGLDIAGIQRSQPLKNFSFPLKLLKSLSEARSIIKSFKPQVCIGVGGYASGPVLWEASSMKIPIVIQEQNSYAGLTNKILAKRALKIFVAYPQMDRFFAKEKIIFTGNPVRSDILQVNEKKLQALEYFGLDPHKKVLLAIGGSLGARKINESLKRWLERLLENNIQLIWQTGKHYFEQARQAVETFHTQNFKVFEFIQPMDLAYAAAEVVVSRAGALSISEICLTQKPAILVPSPNVAEDHQTKNALALVQNKAAWMIPDRHAPDFLVGDAIDLLYDSSLQAQFAYNVSKFAKPCAAQDIATEILKIKS